MNAVDGNGTWQQYTSAWMCTCTRSNGQWIPCAAPVRGWSRCALNPWIPTLPPASSLPTTAAKYVRSVLGNTTLRIHIHPHSCVIRPNKWERAVGIGSKPLLAALAHASFQRKGPPISQVHTHSSINTPQLMQSKLGKDCSSPMSRQPHMRRSAIKFPLVMR